MGLHGGVVPPSFSGWITWLLFSYSQSWYLFLFSCLAPSIGKCLSFNSSETVLLQLCFSSLLLAILFFCCAGVVIFFCFSFGLYLFSLSRWQLMLIPSFPESLDINANYAQYIGYSLRQSSHSVLRVSSFYPSSFIFLAHTSLLQLILRLKINCSRLYQVQRINAQLAPQHVVYFYPAEDKINLVFCIIIYT
jgi:hypothetical protein